MSDPRFKIGQMVYCACRHGRDTVDSVTVTAIWTKTTKDENVFFYDVVYNDGDGEYAEWEMERESYLFPTEKEAWDKLLSRLRGDRVASLHQANLIDQRIKEIEASLETKRETI